jgi:hypothetical protein
MGWLPQASGKNSPYDRTTGGDTVVCLTETPELDAG